MEPIYLDYNATTPIDKQVAEAMKPYLDEYFGNPSSTHRYGVMAKKAVMHAREQVARFINADPEEIIFTSGGSESNNYAIKGIAYAARDRGNHIITSRVEHPAVSEVCRFLESQGYQITYLPVDEYGMISKDDLEAAIQPQTLLITIMHANNEVGTIQPVEEIGRIASKYNIPFHSDAAQSLGKIPVDVRKMGVSLLSVAGHKIYAPKGIGALYVKQGTRLQKLIHGADHELNRRAGTENVLEIVGLGKACEILQQDSEKLAAHMKSMRDLLSAEILKEIPAARVNGHPEKCLPNTLSISFPGIEANTLLAELEGVAASAGAACHTDSVDISPVLQAMNVPVDYAMGTIRFSTGRNTTQNEVTLAAGLVAQTVKRLTGRSGMAGIQTGSHIRLTQYTHGLGCACKIRPQYLEKILMDFPVPVDPKILVSIGTSDDAAVYQINEKQAIVQTVDFFTPVVDDPYQFGAIAASNSLSDIYAMGAQPLFALNIVAFPDNRLPMDVLKSILEGARGKVAEAGIHILGGHTIEDTEPKYGLAVTGIVEPHKVLTNSNLKPGDSLILTKPLGTGIIATAMKRGLAEERSSREAIEVMSRLNKKAAEILSRFPVNACTDVTGFGLLGHLYEMTSGSNMDAEIYPLQVPLIYGAERLAGNGIIPGGTLNNKEFLKEKIEWGKEFSETLVILLCDAQTSGGLLISLPDRYASLLMEQLHAADPGSSAIIGKVIGKGMGKISLLAK